MSSGDWDPGQYERFKAERAQPFWDLAAMVATSPAIERAVDLGCGTGELTAALAQHWGVAEMVGVDNSPNMLRAGEPFAGGAVRFEHGDIATWTDSGRYDVVFANAALQWVGDHAAVLRRWTAALRPGGRLAVQVPANDDHASHLAIVEVAHREPFFSALGGDPPADPVTVNVLRPAEYAELLFELGFARPDVRLQVYPHVLGASADVVEWTKGTSLTRFFKVLPTELHEPFVEAYRAELLRRVGDRSPYLFAFKRILMYGGRAGSS